MEKQKKHVLDERGSATIEFIGIVPLVFFVLLFVWQLIAGAHGLILAHSAVNEAAKVYSVTAEAGEASQAAESIIQAGGSHVSFGGAPISGTDQFTASVTIRIDMVFLPSAFFPGGKPTVSYTADTTGKVIR
ncbi:TadE family protein [Jeotgalibacillus proteolyticus]|nr:TadE/TadG family type IV pilus assembly protein [Jeotgalibacillus proteolyticus]